MAEAGVGEEQVDRAERGVGGIDERHVAGLGGDVGVNGDGAPERLGDRRRVEHVGDDDVGAGGVEPSGQRRADAACPPGHDDVGVRRVPSPDRTCAVQCGASGRSFDAVP